jgi:hypothetical protein
MVSKPPFGLNLKCWTDVQSSEEAGVFKPDPRVYQIAVDGLNVKTEEIVFRLPAHVRPRVHRPLDLNRLQFVIDLTPEKYDIHNLNDSGITEKLARYTDWYSFRK